MIYRATFYFTTDKKCEGISVKDMINFILTEGEIVDFELTDDFEEKEEFEWE